MMRYLFSGPIRKSFRNIPILETPRLILRKILPEDEKDMFEYSRDPETSLFLLWEPHRTIEYTRAHIRYLQKLYREARFFDWAIVEKESKKMIGTCGFTEIYENELRAEVGYVISPKYHRKGFAPEALAKIMEYGFHTLGLSSLSGRFMEENSASQKVLKRMGFSDDSHENEFFKKRGKNQRILTYTISKEAYLNQKLTKNAQE